MMALIWAEGFAGERALAPAWLAWKQAETSLAGIPTTKPVEFAAAAGAEGGAKKRYQSLLAEAAQAATAQTQPRTHVMIVGVGRYETDANIPSVTTSVNGARKFAEWALTQFSHEDRPLGSIEFICSTASGQAEWEPSKTAAERLGFDHPVPEFPTEPATFQNIKKAFESFLARAGAKMENAAIWYFSGHGLFKSETVVMAEDSSLPNAERSGENLIVPARTLYYLQSRPPSVQCFFVDACSEYNADAINNPQEVLGSALCGPTNAPVIPDRDAAIFFGSYAGGKAYGPDNDAPYFTQELIECLTKRAGDATYAGKQVTIASLSQALTAAASRRAELEKNEEIKFYEGKPGVCRTLGVICDLVGPQEILVRVRCRPSDAMPLAKLYVSQAANGRRIDRARPSSSFWYTVVQPGTWSANADFDNGSYRSAPEPFDPKPPLLDVMITAQAMKLADKGGRKP
jgi:hypothetical protein